MSEPDWKIALDNYHNRARCLILDRDGCEVANVNMNRQHSLQEASLIVAAPEMMKVILVLASATGDTDLEDVQNLSQEILARINFGD